MFDIAKNVYKLTSTLYKKIFVNSKNKWKITSNFFVFFWNHLLKEKYIKSFVKISFFW